MGHAARGRGGPERSAVGRAAPGGRRGRRDRIGRAQGIHHAALGGLLDWRWLLGIGAALAAAGGTAAIAMRRRYAAATAEAKEATETPDSEDGQDGESGSETARSEVNGQVTTPGR